MSKHIRIGLVLALATMVAVAYSPAVMAKKDHSNSNSDDNKKDNDQNDQQQQKSSSQQYQKSSGQQFQKFQPNSQNKQFKFDGSQKSFKDQKDDSNDSQKFQNSQKQPQFQNFQKQGSSQNIPKNFQLQGVQNKPDWITKSHNDHKDVKNFVVKFGGDEPFSSKWYKDHPHAWHSHHDHDDAWKVITAASVVGFLGWELYHPRPTVVVYQPVPYDTLFVSRPGVIIDPSRGEWMPLGQFALMMGPGDNGTRMLDLATDRFGHIRGSYYDMITGASQNVAGIIDARTQYAQWSLETNRGLTFYTPMGEMMQPQGLVYVQLPSGERQQWQLVRMEGGGY